MSLLEQVYRQVIMERSRKPRHRGTAEPTTHEKEGVNPSCGDELTLTLNVADGVIREARFTGSGCAISLASADLMADAVTGLPVEEALSLGATFRNFIRGEDPAVDLGELQALEGVRQLHARVKCATLAWLTLEAALKDHPVGAHPTS